ncbi:hypothetical protein ERM63_18680 [Clostridioides difficile]|nr:hypothetical protein [Clostridioides difficile]
MEHPLKRGFKRGFKRGYKRGGGLRLRLRAPKCKIKTKNRKGVSENHAHILLAAFTSLTR